MRFLAIYLFLLLPLLAQTQNRCFRTASRYLSFVNEPPSPGQIKYNKFIDYEGLIEIRNAAGHLLALTDGLKFYTPDLKPLDSLGSVPEGYKNTKWWKLDEKKLTILTLAEPNRGLVLVNIPLLNGQLDFKNKTLHYPSIQTPIWGRISTRFIGDQIIVAYFKRDTLVLTQIERNGSLIGQEEKVFKEFTPYSELTNRIVENLHFSHDAKTLLVETIRSFDPDSNNQQLFALSITNLQVAQIDSLYSQGFTTHFDSTIGVISDDLYLFNSLAFSPNDSLIYAARDNYIDFIPDIIQLDRFANKHRKRRKHEVNFNIDGNDFSLGYLFQGPNRKMYFHQVEHRIKQYYIGRIEHPDSFGKAAHFQASCFKLGSFPRDLNYPFRQYAQFTAGIKGHEWQFQNISDADYVRFQWHWGDGDSLYSNSKSLSHRFRSPGKHLVKLKAFTAQGYYVWYSDSIEAKSRIRLSAKTESQKACQWQQVNFLPEVITQVADPDKEEYVWDFGDGNSSSDARPQHVYESPGSYSWSLRYTNGYDTATFNCNNCLRVQAAPKAALAVEEDSLCVPDQVALRDLSTGSIGSRTYYLNRTLLGNSLPTPTLSDTGQYYIKVMLNPDSFCSPQDSIALWGLPKAGDAPKLRRLEVQANGRVYLSTLRKPLDSLLIRTKDYSAASTDSAFVDTKAFAKDASRAYTLSELDQCGNASASTIYSTAFVRAYTQNGIDFQVTAQLHDANRGTQGGLRVLSASGQLLHSEKLSHTTTNTNYRLPNGYDQDSIFFEAHYQHKKDSTIWISNREAIPTDGPKIWLPSAFSPNGDGTNDLFLLHSYQIDTMEVRVFDRWGAMVFYSNERLPAWDGRKGTEELPVGSYFCIVTGKFGDEQLQQSGMLLLMR